MGGRRITVVLVLVFAQLSLNAKTDPGQFRNELARATTDSQRLNTYREIYTYYRESNSDTCRFYLEQGIRIFTEHDYIKGKAVLMGMISGIYSDQGATAAAQKAAEEGLLLFSSLKDEPSIAKAHNTLGVIEGKKGNFDIAIRHFLSALQYFEKVSDTPNIITTYVKLGTANDLSDNFDKAMEYFHKGLDLSMHTKRSANIANLYNNIGSSFARSHHFDTALVYLRKALDYSEDPRFLAARIPPLMNMGGVYAELNDYKKALGYYYQALELARSGGLKEEIGKSLHSIGFIESISAGTITPTFYEALKIAREAGSKRQEMDILKDMAHVADTIGNYKAEVAFLKQERALHDSLFNMEKARQIANLQSEYELNKSNTQLAQLRKSEQRNLEKKNLIIVIACVLALTLLTLFLFFIRTLKLNSRLSLREQDLKKVNAVKDRLFSIIGHDLRGPIGNIPALLHIYKSEETSEEERSFILDSLEENSVASLETLEKLLSWGNLQIKGNTLNQIIFNAGEILNDTLRLLGVTATNKNVTIINTVSADVQVYADENHFKFIVRNLLSNAVKYTRPGGLVELSAGQNADENQVIFSIRDNGIGIAKEEQEHIFEPYNKSINGTANESGTSIGLMLCKEFVLQNGGNIWVESKKGDGATFYFTVMGAGNKPPEVKRADVAVRDVQNVG